MRRRYALPLVLLPALVFVSGFVTSPELGAQTIKIGAVQPLTGVFGFAGVEIHAGLQDSLDTANEAGGINGKKIEYFVEDGEYKLPVAQQAFERILARYNPLIMYGESTALGKAMADQIKAKYKILYSSTSFSGELAQSGLNPYVFVPGPTYGDQFAILLKYIARAKPNAKVAFFYSDTEFGKDPLKFGRMMCRELRLDLVTEQVTAPGAVEVGPQVEALKKNSPDFVIFQGYVVDPMPAVIKQSRELGLQCKFMGTFWGTTKMVLDKLGPLAEGYMGVSPYNFWWMDDVPMIRKIKAYNTRKHPEVKFRPIFYMQGFVTGLIFVECLKRADSAGRLDGDGLVKALQSLQNFDTEGLTAPLTIRNNRFPVAKIWRANVQKGIFEPAPLPPGLKEWIEIGF